MPRINLVARAAAMAALCAFAAAGAQSSPARPFRALFIGNSYTYYNNLPAQIADIAAAAKEPRPFEAYVVLVGGSSLEAHLTRGIVQQEIAKGNWDAVILQDQSARPLTDPAKTIRDVKTFADLAKQVNAPVYVYESWARDTAPEMQDSLTHVVHAAAAAAGVKVLHAGEAWKAFRDAEGRRPAGQRGALFNADGSHPAPMGTYLTANVMYATFYGKSPLGAPNGVRVTTTNPQPGPAPDAPRDTIPSAVAKRLQAIAWDVARKHK